MVASHLFLVFEHTHICVLFTSVASYVVIGVAGTVREAEYFASRAAISSRARFGPAVYAPTSRTSRPSKLLVIGAGSTDAPSG